MLAIAIDIGGTKIEGSLVDERAKIHKTWRIPTGEWFGKKTVLKNIETVILELKLGQGDIAGIGISMPGFVDSNGKVLFAGGTIKSLINFNLRKYIEERCKLPVFIENDANCFALAEAVYGAGKNHKVVIGVVWGTGIGGGIVMNNKVFRGAYGAAGEFGHIVVNADIKSGRKCGCGQYGCLEILASGKNIEEIYKTNKGRIQNANLRQIYNSKEKIAKQIINNAIHFLGISLANLVNVLNPDIIVLGGGASKLPDSAYNEIRKEVKKYAMKDLTRNLKITRYKISDAAGVLGAAALVFEEIKVTKSLC